MLWGTLITPANCSPQHETIVTEISRFFPHINILQQLFPLNVALKKTRVGKIGLPTKYSSSVCVLFSLGEPSVIPSEFNKL